MDDLEQADDWQLIQQCVLGSRCAWDALVERKTATLFVLLWHYLGADRFDRHLLEDLVQTIWFRLIAQDYKRLRRYQQEAGSFRNWGRF